MTSRQTKKIENKSIIINSIDPYICPEPVNQSKIIEEFNPYSNIEEDKILEREFCILNIE